MFNYTVSEMYKISEYKKNTIYKQILVRNYKLYLLKELGNNNFNRNLKTKQEIIVRRFD